MKDKKEIYMYVLGAVIVLGFFGVVIYKLYKGSDIQLEIGALLASFAAVVGYFFGSSKGSSDKTDMLKDKSVM